jgi:hypothetical protein
MEFIDISGASGTIYRFRQWPSSGALPPIAGNYAVVDPARRKVVALGMMEDLSQAAFQLADVADAGSIFTRYNVSRAHREMEHADLIAQHPDLAENLA